MKNQDASSGSRYFQNNPPQSESRRHATDRRRTGQNLLPGTGYPTSLIDVWHVKNGTRLTIRPVLPQDGALLGKMIQGLSPETRHNRFHGAVNGLSAEALRQMSCVDYLHHLAFVITTCDTHQERVVADARYFVDAQGDSAEFAIVVDDGWQRMGLGERAMQTLVQAADLQGLSWLHGSVLSGNASMLSLMQRCQFCAREDRGNDNLVCVEKHLGQCPAIGRSIFERYLSSRWLSVCRSFTRS